MKVSKLIAASALALATAPALAVTAFEAPDVTVYLSGATAPDNFLATIAIALFTGAQGTDWHRFQDNGGTAAVFTDDGTQFNAFFGQVKNTADIPLNLRLKKVLLIKRSKGGSVWGVDPVARASPIATLQISAVTCVLNTNIQRCPQVGVDPGLGTPTGQEQVPDFGVSDVSPAMFKGPFNVEFGQAQLSPAETARLNIFPVNVLMMGYSATDAIPTTTYFSKAAYGAMLSGLYQDWTQVNAALAPAAGNQVLVCRRVPGSGTQTSYNWYFNNFPCSANTTPARMADSAGYNDGDGDGYPDTCFNTVTSAEVPCTAATGGGSTLPFIVDPTAGYTVVENSTSGNVRNCLRLANNGGVHTFVDEQGKSFRINFGTGGYGAIGVLSADSQTQENGWRFRGEEGAGSYLGGVYTGTGVGPTQANLIEGRYQFGVELTMQYRKVAVGAVPALSGLKKDFADEFIKRAGAPAFQSLATSSLPPTYTPAAGQPIAKGTRFGDMCSPLQLLF